MAAPSVTALALASRRPGSRGRRSTGPATGGAAGRVLRKASPVRIARGTADWAKRPTGRFVLPAVVAVLLLGAAGTAGAYLVPQALDSTPEPSVTPGFGQEAQLPPASAGQTAPLPSLGLPSLGLPSALPVPTDTGMVPTTGPAAGGPVAGVPTTAANPATAAVPGARPADSLAGWAQRAGTMAGIPVVAAQAYGYAEMVLSRTQPNCHLSWTTIAAIAEQESAHGSYGQSVLNADGTVSPPIIGLPLDGKGSRQLIRDTDQGVLDNDTTYDRAIGPMQFIPQTWNEIAVGNTVDADNNGISDPHDIDDAALATGVYLCTGGRDLSRPDAWWEAILSYNAVRPYAQDVYNHANRYGQLTGG